MEIEITAIKKPVEQKDEMFGFEFDGNDVSFEGQSLDPAIASGIFLMYERMKKKCNERNVSEHKRKAQAKQLKDIAEYNKNRKESITGLLRKVANLEAQNKALIEYVKNHK